MTDINNNNRSPEPLSASTINWPETWIDDLSYDVDKVIMNIEDALFDVEDALISTQTLPSASIKLETRRISSRFSTLSEAEERRLRAIAMPSLASQTIASFLASFPTSSTFLPPHKSTRATRKRKSLSMVTEDQDLDLDDDSSETQTQSRKRGHNAIENATAQILTTKCPV